MGDLGIDTAIDGEHGRYQARLSRDWEIWGPNGGYVAALALRAAGAASTLRRPASFSGHFLNVAEFDVVDLEVTTLRAAKRAESLRVSITQRGRPIFEAAVWVVGDADGLQHDDATMPAVPAPDTLKPVEELATPEDLQGRHRFWSNFDIRPLAWKPWRLRSAGPPSWREWLRFRPQPDCTDPFVDAARSLLLIDTMGWPAACQPHPQQQEYIAPSLDVYAQFHRLDARSEWLLIDVTAPIANDGMIGCQARVWSESGRLLASGGGQLLCRRMPPA